MRHELEVGAPQQPLEEADYEAEGDGDMLSASHQPQDGTAAVDPSDFAPEEWTLWLAAGRDPHRYHELTAGGVQ
ncbi:hypothetical protein CYMTET_51466 [Cymbomonas tetramitiformis]|uniref:Uncharacterized protein n=1 Tax=Cymbomonas tetramitiformis TaxID=36881 RepID=A0AAE0ETN5_9CHLO|nr:hypothetical protein CYMTET_51466 [Cymbomonas tetramitiformis]